MISNADPDHRSPMYHRTRTVTVNEISIGNQLFVCFSCSCSGLHFEKHACRHMYALLHQFPSLKDFMPECFKSYDVTYGSDPQYTQSVNRMRSIIKECGGLLFEQPLGDVAKNIQLENNLEFFENTYRSVVDINPRSNVIKRNGNHAHKLIPDFGSLSTKVCGPHSGYSAMHPLFSYIMEQCTQQANLDAVNEGLHKILGVVLKQNGRTKHDEDKERDVEKDVRKPLNTQTDLFGDISSPVRSISNNLNPGSIFTTPSVDTRNEHKRHASGGSPSRFKKRPKGSSD